MAAVRVTKVIAQHIVDCVMANTKRTYELQSIYPKIREFLLSTMPVQIQEISKDPVLAEHLQWGYVYVKNNSVGIRGYISGSYDLPDTLKQEIAELSDLCKKENEQRTQVGINLLNQLLACKNLNKVAEVFPEFNKYFKQYLVPDTVYPIQSKSVMDELSALGYKP